MQDKEISHKVLEFQPGTRLAKSLVEIPTQRVRFAYPASMVMMEFFSPIFKWIVPGIVM